MESNRLSTCFAQVVVALSAPPVEGPQSVIGTLTYDSSSPSEPNPEAQTAPEASSSAAGPSVTVEAAKAEQPSSPRPGRPSSAEPRYLSLYSVYDALPELGSNFRSFKQQSMCPGCQSPSSGRPPANGRGSRRRTRGLATSRARRRRQVSLLPSRGLTRVASSMPSVMASHTECIPTAGRHGCSRSTAPAEVGCERRVQARRRRLALAAAGAAGQGHPAAAGGRGEHQDQGRGAQGEPGGRAPPAPHQQCGSCRPTQQRLPQPDARCHRQVLPVCIMCSAAALQHIKDWRTTLCNCLRQWQPSAAWATQRHACRCGVWQEQAACSYLCHDCAAGNAHERDPASNRCTMTSAAPVRHLRDAPSAPITRLPTDVPVPAAGCPEAGSSGDQISFKLGRLPCPHAFRKELHLSRGQ